MIVTFSLKHYFFDKNHLIDLNFSVGIKLHIVHWPEGVFPLRCEEDERKHA